MNRLLLNTALALAIVFLPWWLATAIACVLLAYCDAYEVVLWGLFADGLYAVPAPMLSSFEFVFTAVWTLALCVSLLIKPHLIFYAQR
jgi:hypothetical protein